MVLEIPRSRFAIDHMIDIPVLHFQCKREASIYVLKSYVCDSRVVEAHDGAADPTLLSITLTTLLAIESPCELRQHCIFSLNEESTLPAKPALSAS